MRFIRHNVWCVHFLHVKAQLSVLSYLSWGDDTHQVLHGWHPDGRLRVLQTQKQRCVRVVHKLHTRTGRVTQLFCRFICSCSGSVGGSPGISRCSLTGRGTDGRGVYAPRCWCPPRDSPGRCPETRSTWGRQTPGWFWRWQLASQHPLVVSGRWPTWTPTLGRMAAGVGWGRPSGRLRVRSDPGSLPAASCEGREPRQNQQELFLWSKTFFSGLQRAHSCGVVPYRATVWSRPSPSGTASKRDVSTASESVFPGDFNISKISIFTWSDMTVELCLAKNEMKWWK